MSSDTPDADVAEGAVSRIDRFREDFDRIVYRFRQNPTSLLGLGLIFSLVLVAVFAPWVAPYPQDAGYGGKPAVHFDQRFESPSIDHPFGTDQAGRDLFSRVIFGTRISLGIGIVVLTIAIGIGGLSCLRLFTARHQLVSTDLRSQKV